MTLCACMAIVILTLSIAGSINFVGKVHSVLFHYNELLMQLGYEIILL